MVLTTLGSKLVSALHNMGRSVIVDQLVVNKMVQDIVRALLEADVNVHLVKQLQQSIEKQIRLESLPPGANKRKFIQSVVVKSLLGLLDAGIPPFSPKRDEANVVLFVGLQGSGKTTTCCKYASFYKKKGWKVGLICADTFRAGAFDQLKQNAMKCEIPFYGSYTETDPAILAEAGVDKFRRQKCNLIIIDTSGRHKQQAELFEEMRGIVQATHPTHVVFVIDGSIGQAAKAQAEAFRSAIEIGSVIVTKLDGHAKGGGALSAVTATRSPISFIGTGEGMADLEAFQPAAFVSRLLGLGDMEGLRRLLEEKKVSDSKCCKKIQEGGDFTFRDVREQMHTILATGTSIMPMIPGLPRNWDEKGTQEQVKRWIVIMDSMTAHELDGDDKVFHTQHGRVCRLARGAGVTEEHVMHLIRMFKTFKKTMGVVKGKDPRAVDVKQVASALGARLPANMNISSLMKQFHGKLPF